MFSEQNKLLIEGLYEVFLNRKPDPLGMKDKQERLNSGIVTPKDIINEIINSEEFLLKIRSFVSNLRSYPLTNNQSQYNEFEILINHIITINFAEKVIVEVGARGKERSNSYDFLKFFGWKGLLIEANPNLIDEIKRDFGEFNCEIVQKAVSDYCGEATFTIGINDDVSSLDFATAESWGKTKGSIDVDVMRLHNILENYLIPKNFGIFSLDIEGEDIRVINDLIENSLYRPQYIIIEASYDFKTKSLNDLPVKKAVLSNYEMIGQSRANLILSLKNKMP